MAIRQAAGAKALETADNIRSKLDELSQFFPPGMKVAYPYDTTPFVMVAIQEVVKTLLEAIVLVFLVMYLFMGNVRATLTPTIAVPVVILGTFAVLGLFGFSINMLTMFAMVLAIGFLVDDAIVVVENVERIMTVAGVSFSGRGQNSGLAFIKLRDWGLRDRPGLKVGAVAGRAMERFSRIRNTMVLAFAPPAVVELGQAKGFDFQLLDRGGLGHARLMKARNQLLGMAATNAVLIKVRPNGLEDVPEYRTDVDWERAGVLGVAIPSIHNTISAAFGSAYVNDFIQGGRVKRVYAQAGPLYAFFVLFIFLCLAALYESWPIPISILLALPLGVIGGVIASSLRGLPNDVYSQIGLLTTLGLTTKNAILIVQFAKARVEEGMGLTEATLEAAKLRLRPIVMTSLAFGFGVLPLVLASGAGAGAQVAIGTSVIGGVITSTFLVIVFAPLFYVMIQRTFGKARLAGSSPGSAGPKPGSH